MKKNISINNGLSYVNAAELTAEQVNDLFDQVWNCFSDETTAAALAASEEFEDETAANRAWLATAAELEGEIVVG